MNFTKSQRLHVRLFNFVFVRGGGEHEVWRTRKYEPICQERPVCRCGPCRENPLPPFQGTRGFVRGGLTDKP